jgi:hypothetical protein
LFLKVILFLTRFSILNKVQELCEDGWILNALFFVGFLGAMEQMKTPGPI